MSQLTSACSPQYLAYLVLEALLAGRRNAQARLFVPRLAVSEELALPRTRHRTLALVDLELEPFAQEPGQVRQQPLSRPFAFDIHVAVVSKTAETVPPAFQFPIQIRQQDVGQQWAQGAALRHPLAPRAEVPVCQHPRCQVTPDQLQYPRIAHLFR